jgi:hypothetical protein
MKADAGLSNDDPLVETYLGESCRAEYELGRKDADRDIEFLRRYHNPDDPGHIAALHNMMSGYRDCYGDPSFGVNMSMKTRRWRYGRSILRGKWSYGPGQRYEG